MENLKFRAWLKKEKKLVEVLAIDFQYREISIAPLNDKLNKFSQSGNQYCIVSPIPFNDCIIEQFTGLLDKNKKEICVGDIVKEYWQKVGNKVIFSNGSYGFFDSDNYFRLLSDTCEVTEVIGNIHENPELLEVGK